MCFVGGAYEESSRRTVLKDKKCHCKATKYVSIGEKTIIEPSDVITDVVDETAMQDETGGIIVVRAEVASVISIDSYVSCRNCLGKVLETKNGVGECGKCNAKVKLAKCKNRNVARIEIEDEKGGTQYKLMVFDDVVEQIVRFCREDGCSEEDLSDLLLLSPMLSYTVNLNKLCALWQELCEQLSYAFTSVI